MTMHSTANRVIRQREQDAAFASENSILNIALKDSPNGILIVDQRGRIVFSNDNFFDMWRLPRGLADAPTTAPTIDAVLPKLKYPDGFVARLNYLHAHPEEESHESFELKDERVLHRYSRSLYAADRSYIGRIWFFRDVTEERIAERRIAEALSRTRRQVEIVGLIGQSEALILGDVDGIARQITELASEATGCERVNVWLFNDDETELRCIDLFEATPARHSSGMTLSDREFGNEIAILKSSRYVNADDPLTDPRTAGYVEPYLKPLGITSMLDAVIRVSEHHFGLLCFEHVGKPHHWTDDEISFACQLADKIGLAVISRSRRQAEAMTRAVERLASIGGWVLNVGDDKLHWSEEVFHIIGGDPQNFPATLANFMSIVHPDDLQRVQENLAATLEKDAPYSIEFRIVRPDRTERIIHAQGETTVDQAGNVVRLTGTCHDITERRTTELALQRTDALLHALANTANQFVTAASLDEAMVNALELVGKTTGVDRMVILDSPQGAGKAPRLRYVWQASDVAFRLTQEFFDNPQVMTREIATWRLPLLDGRIVTSHLRDAKGDLKAMLEQLGTKTILLVPILIDRKYWGRIALESCKAERVWADAEIEVLQTLGNLIVNSIQRERYVGELANANRIVQNSPTILYRLRGEPSLPLIYISQNIRLFGYEPAALTGSPHLYFDLVHPDDRPAMRDAMAHVLDTEHPAGVVEYRFLTSRGEYRSVENRYNAIRDSRRRLVELEGLLIDITERKAAEERIAHLARTDPLTGLANRSTFSERLAQAFASSRRGASDFALLSLDIDRFKDINDTLGHPIGDGLLIAVGERLKAAVRKSDTVARLGGDEFAILQSDLADVADAGALAAKIRDALAAPVVLNGNELRVTVSIGISTYATEIATPDEMLSQADVALYRAKDEGRDQFRFHTAQIDGEVREQVAVTTELGMAIGRDEFELHYQPQIELDTGRIVGMEALIRWNHPTRGVLLPSAFLSIAEKSGAITAIGQWVLDQACKQMSIWQAIGIAPPIIAVNLSDAPLKVGSEFVQFVTDTLAKWGLAPNELQLDVTESMLARATLAQSEVLMRLQKLGINISIDDFGTKFSTLDYLRTYRVNRLKIPQMLIDAVPRDPDSAAMLRAILGIARELNIEVVAQGVETEAQWMLLTTRAPVGKVQGFFYSKPVPAGPAEQLLRRGRIEPAAEYRDAAPPIE